MSDNYPPPVDRLLTRGRPPMRGWPDYAAELGLNREHVPDLIRLATADRLGFEGSPAVWGPVHAWRAPGQLRAVEAVKPLLQLLGASDEIDDDWLREEVPEVLAMIGPPAVDDLVDYLNDSSRMDDTRIAVARALRRLGTLHPEARPACVLALSGALAQHAENDPTLNGFLVSELTDLKAVEALPVSARRSRREASTSLSPGVSRTWRSSWASGSGAPRLAGSLSSRRLPAPKRSAATTPAPAAAGRITSAAA